MPQILMVFSNNGLDTQQSWIGGVVLPGIRESSVGTSSGKVTWGCGVRIKPS